jgi:PKD repeat protein
VNVGGTVDVPIVLDKAPNGLSGAEFTVTLSDGACADIVGFTYPAWATLKMPDPFPGPRDSITFKMVDGSGTAVALGATNVPLGTLKIRGTAVGTTSVVIAPTPGWGIQDRVGTILAVTAPPGSVTVLAPTPSPTPTPSVITVPGGGGTPTDTDADGKYDDVNGNSRRDFADVGLYFNQMSWITANEPLSYFDYNANSRIDFADVVWLFNNL